MEKLQFAQKAWEIDFGRVEEGYMFEKVWAYGNTVGQTKQELLVEVEGCKNYLGEEITFLNIPIIRCKEKDKYYFEGEPETVADIEYIKALRERTNELDAMLADNNITHCYIRKGSYYRPGSSGYTDMRHRAGVFSTLEAVSSARHCKDLTIIPVGIDEHNKMIEDEINDLKTRLI